jgi:ElaB/YqjD/DUF883 family membrane-anchored ribosome-binding protein
MARKRKTASDEIAAVEELMQDLEARLQRLNSRPKSDESTGPDEISNFVAQTLSRIAAQVRSTADVATETLADQATEASTDIIRKIWDEMQKRPLTTLALAAAAGYLLGLVSKQEDAE